MFDDLQRCQIDRGLYPNSTVCVRKAGECADRRACGLQMEAESNYDEDGTSFCGSLKLLVSIDVALGL